MYDFEIKSSPRGKAQKMESGDHSLHPNQMEMPKKLVPPNNNSEAQKLQETIDQLTEKKKSEEEKNSSLHKRLNELKREQASLEEQMKKRKLIIENTQKDTKSLRQKLESLEAAEVTGKSR